MQHSPSHTHTLSHTSYCSCSPGAAVHTETFMCIISPLFSIKLLWQTARHRAAAASADAHGWMRMWLIALSHSVETEAQTRLGIKMHRCGENVSLWSSGGGGTCVRRHASVCGHIIFSACLVGYKKNDNTNIKYICSIWHRRPTAGGRFLPQRRGGGGHCVSVKGSFSFSGPNQEICKFDHKNMQRNQVRKAQQAGPFFIQLL